MVYILNTQLSILQKMVNTCNYNNITFFKYYMGNTKNLCQVHINFPVNIPFECYA